MNPRFYAPDARAGAVTALPDEEAQHLTRVLRLKSGAAIRVFDGHGHEFDAVVAKAAKSEVLVDVGAQRSPSAAESRVAITLAQAVLKGDKMDDVVRDAVMMGVAAIQPIVTARTEVALATLQRGRRRERWQRIAVSSAKQCGRAVVPEVREPATFDAVAVAVGGLAPVRPVVMFVEPTVCESAVALTELERAVPLEATVIVGPEGGWTQDEIRQSAVAARLITLHMATLRADAVAVVGIAALLAWWQQL